MANFHISLTVSALQDIRDASAWYDDQQPGLDSRFLKEFENACNKIRLNPELYGFYGRSIIARRIRLKKFPYNVFYSITDQTIDILAIIHTARSEKHLHKRLL